MIKSVNCVFKGNEEEQVKQTDGSVYQAINSSVDPHVYAGLQESQSKTEAYENIPSQTSNVYETTTSSDDPHVYIELGENNKNLYVNTLP